MKFLGNSLHISNSGKLIAISNKTPTADGTVFDSEKNKIGRVNHVFGSTKKPYVSINLFKSADINRIQNNYGEKLFVSRLKKKKSKKRRRNHETKNKKSS